jgi:hypothetical protein
LAVAGAVILALALARLADDPAGQYAIDFGDYHKAAQRLAAGESPYAPEMLEGPVDAQGLDRYRYPPPLAQLLVPIAGMPLPSAALLWLVAQTVAIAAASWLALRAGMRRTPSLEATLWAVVAGVFFMPIFDTLWKGNVSGFLALLVMLAALGARTAGVGVSAAVLLKVVPVALAPGLVARGPRAWTVALATGAAAVTISVALAPHAWRDYLVVLPNLLMGVADYPTNLAPAAILSDALPPLATSLVRLLTIGVALLCLLSAWSAGRRPGQAAMAVLLGTVAMLLLPAALWYHYLAVLLPLAIVAWCRGDTPARLMLMAGGALISLGLASLSLVLVGGPLLVAGAVRALRSPPSPHAIPTTLPVPRLP